MGARRPTRCVDDFDLDNNAFFVQQQSTFADRWFVDRRRARRQQGKLRHVLQPEAVGRRLRGAGPDGALSSLKVFGNIGKGIKSPTFSSGSAAASPIRQPDLKVERARTGDVGVEATFADQRFAASVTYFNNDYHRSDRVPLRRGRRRHSRIHQHRRLGGRRLGARGRAAAAGAGVHRVRQLLVRRHRVVTAISTSQQFQPGQPLLRRPRHSGTLRGGYTAGRVTVNFDVRSSAIATTTASCPSSGAEASMPHAVSRRHHRQPGLCRRRAGRGRARGSRVTVFIRGNNIGTPNTTACSVSGHAAHGDGGGAVRLGHVIRPGSLDVPPGKAPASLLWTCSAMRVTVRLGTGVGDGRASRARRRAPQTPDAEQQTDAARREAAEQQRDHPDVPQRTPVVPEREVQAVQAVVEPALDAAEPVDLREHLAHFRIDVDPGLGRVVELHAQNRQRRLAVRASSNRSRTPSSSC